ncbi:DEAD/DEAH box helicase [Amycolatopsis saalfeldensis]|uniref:ATP-dependent helicase Lhr and Lhr-like helicase n=1 Tax=Amycolatopsis saalfeldensis TaxID=394193 RepID=A0A1H8YPQ9_9PSEU|nr:DEAD/DEAH box helicase [Amycolatopsis saalfeldensis]SEP54167.1 ATP-dependent helicase Lhr and Lhr-like helicase [Amycolatopsis saalfeldensis]
MSEDDAFTALHPAVRYHLVNTLRWPSLRPLQEAAVRPLLAGEDCLLLAPTAGGKTEAALLPVLTRMAEENWQDVSVLYVCPLRALLNNLHPRVASYTAWLGRSAALWHGDIGQADRARILRERPDVLLTTPESIEAMLVSTKVDPHALFSGLRAIVVDEVHAFAGDDRGWHLLAVLERLERVVGRPLQRIGLSATVGNPEELLSWLQGAHAERLRRVVAPKARETAAPDITLDYVGSVANAAKVIASLHDGEKRLVFVDSRRIAEELGTALRGHGVTTFLSHSSLSAAERRRAEEAFAESRDTVIVATSTLELGVDVGDLDRVIQLDAPRTVASFLQRLGRTGRRPGTLRNCLFLCLSEDSLLQAAGLLERWSAGWVEPITAPPSPRHIVAQQLLALALQEHRIGAATWRQWWGSLPMFDEHSDEILRFLHSEGFLEADGDFLFIGPEAEHRFGRRYFSDLTAVFSAPPEFTVLQGRHEIGTVSDDLLVEEVDGPRVLLLAGHAWRVERVDWQRRRCWVEPTDQHGRAKWTGRGGGLSFDLTRGMRAVLLGADPPGVNMTKRADTVLSRSRDELRSYIAADATLVIEEPGGAARWWTWAGTSGNRTLQASLPGVVAPRQRINDRSLRLLPDLDRKDISAAIDRCDLVLPYVDRGAVAGLKFSVALPDALALRTVAERLADKRGATTTLGEPWRFTRMA